MIDRFLRRLTVRRRIAAGFLVLLFLSALALPLIVADHVALTDRLRQIADVEARADRLLLLASTRITSSRVNLMRYVDDYSPSAHESLADVDRANQLLIEARDIITSPDQRADVAAVLEKLVEYRKLISDVQTARTEGRQQDVSQLLFQAYRLEGEIWQRIERIVSDSETRVMAANESVYAEAQNRLLFLVVGFGGTLILALIVVSLLQRSITRPVTELRSGAEAFRQGHMDATIPVVGTDELSLLAQAFNQMAAQLRNLIGTLEQRVAQRTRELEWHSGYLEAAAEVSRAATSILEADQLIQQVVELILVRFDLYYVGLFLVDEAGEWAVLRAGTGEAGRAMLARGHRIRVGEGMIGWSIASAQARIVSETEADAMRLTTPELPDTRSEAALPLRSRGQVLGALTVQSAQPDAFDQAIIAVLQTMVDQVAVALDNARLFTEAQQALEAERRAYGEIGREAWARMIRARPDWGYRCDLQGVHSSAGNWQPEMEQAARDGRVVLAGDSATPTVAVPIRVRGRVVGALDFRKADENEVWTTEELVLLEALAEQLGQALESARLYRETQRGAARDRLMREIADKMRRAADMDSLLRTTIREMGVVLGTPSTFVQLSVPSGLAVDENDKEM